MKKYCFTTLLLLTYLFSSAQIGAIIWEDNFDTFNPEVWTKNVGDGCDEGLCGWGNAELQWYAENNVNIEDIPGEPGNKALVFEAKNENVGTRSFTSGKVDSDGKLSIHYGLIETRIRVPDLETGLWPAAWLLGTADIGWPAKGEIDMMEMGHNQAERDRLGHGNADLNNYVGANAIFATSDGNYASIAWDVNYNQPYVSNTSMADRFVTYRFYWEPTQMRFTIIDNGTEYDLYTNVFPIDANGETAAFTEPFYLLLNLAIGGNFTDAATNAQVTSPLPAKMYIDYVRVHEWNGYGSVDTEYVAPEEVSGTFGVFTDDTPTESELLFGVNSEIYIWGGTLTPSSSPAAEGSNVLSWQTTTDNSWFGAGIVASGGLDMSAYEADGSLKFKIKAPADLAFRIGITDNYGNENWIVFNAYESKYGLVRDGEWGQVTIPLSDFSGALNFQSINYMFAISSVDGALPPANTEIAIDDILWCEGITETIVEVNLKALLEGATEGTTMHSTLNDLGLLPGQSPLNTLLDPTPAGQPYYDANNWGYTGTEGIGWTDTDYTDIEALYNAAVVDWVLVSFRTTTNASSTFAKAASLLLSDANIVFPHGSPIRSSHPDSFYILVEHRNHVGILTPTAVNVNNNIASYDFTGSSAGQKSMNGVWAMYAGEILQDGVGYDINGNDKAYWAPENGNFSIYLNSDINLDGDVNGSDKAVWAINNGISSNISRE